MPVEQILAKYEKTCENVLLVLEDIQMEYNYLPKDALLLISKTFNVPMSRVYSLATFYKIFSLKPKGKHIVQVCLGTACQVRGGEKIVESIERLLEISAGETTPDGLFTLETVNCIGACALGPVLVLDGKYHGKITPPKTTKLIKEYKK